MPSKQQVYRSNLLIRHSGEAKLHGYYVIAMIYTDRIKRIKNHIGTIV